MLLAVQGGVTNAQEETTNVGYIGTLGTVGSVTVLLVTLVLVIVAVVYRRQILQWVASTDGEAAATPTTAPLAYRLLVIAILCVTALFMFTVLLFAGERGPNGPLFNDAAQVIAALSLAFTVIGTLVGTYFGIKQSSESRVKEQEVAQQTVDASARAMDYLCGKQLLTAAFLADIN